MLIVSWRSDIAIHINNVSLIDLTVHGCGHITPRHTASHDMADNAPCADADPPARNYTVIATQMRGLRAAMGARGMTWAMAAMSWQEGRAPLRGVRR